jgi:uncharacterized protein involved in propanediol utilization
MANGQKKSDDNIELFKNWAASLSDKDFKEITHRGLLNRGEVAKGAGIGKSALSQNPSVKELLKNLENRLREKGVLPEITSTESSDETQQSDATAYDQTARKRNMESRNIANLEAKVLKLEVKIKRYAELENEVEALKAELSKYESLKEYKLAMTELGVLPR